MKLKPNILLFRNINQSNSTTNMIYLHFSRFLVHSETLTSIRRRFAWPKFIPVLMPVFGATILLHHSSETVKFCRISNPWFHVIKSDPIWPQPAWCWWFVTNSIIICVCASGGEAGHVPWVLTLRRGWSRPLSPLSTVTGDWSLCRPHSRAGNEFYTETVTRDHREIMAEVIQRKSVIERILSEAILHVTHAHYQ